jgi:hypothetical protein
MFLRSEFIIYEENESLIEFRDNRSTLFVSFLIDLSIFLICFLAAMQDPMVLGIFILAIGILALAHGIAPLLFQRKIVIHKNRKELFFIGGAKRFFLKSAKIQFSQVSHILIKETFESSRGEGEFSGGKDKIYLVLNGRDDINIENSCGDMYTNEFAYKLSEAIGCKVVCERF